MGVVLQIGEQNGCSDDVDRISKKMTAYMLFKIFPVALNSNDPATRHLKEANKGFFQVYFLLKQRHHIVV